MTHRSRELQVQHQVAGSAVGATDVPARVSSRLAGGSSCPSANAAHCLPEQQAVPYRSALQEVAIWRETTYLRMVTGSVAEGKCSVPTATLTKNSVSEARRHSVTAQQCSAEKLGRSVRWLGKLR